METLLKQVTGLKWQKRFWLLFSKLMLNFKFYLKLWYYWLCCTYYKCILWAQCIFCDRLNVYCELVQRIFLWQVDLGMEVNVTGIATQGESYQKRFWTEKYTLNFSRDGVNFFADTPPLDGRNVASEEHKRVIINYIKNCCAQRSDVINEW